MNVIYFHILQMKQKILQTLQIKKIQTCNMRNILRSPMLILSRKRMDF